jgi:D-xylose 1-dehydrogenase (NADP+, D-xylono-1,5-lactone-forming)
MQAGRLRFGIIGTSRIADTQIRAIRASDNCELRAVASRDLDRGRAWARDRDIPIAFGSYDEMLASDEIDAVYNPLPNSLHKEWSVRAAQHGKHVLCEKPVASGPAELQEMIAAADAHGVKLMEAFMYRFHPQIELVRQLLADGTIGEIKIIRATFGFYLDGPKDIRWDIDLAGGALMDVGSYCVSIVRLLVGAEPVAGSASAVWAPSGVDQSLAGTLEFPGGVLGSIDCSFETGVEMQQGLDISGTRGRIQVAEPFRLGEGPPAILISSTGRNEIVHAPGANEYRRMVEHFAGAVLSNSPVAYTPQDSLGCMHAIAALYESARTGKRVEVAK